MSKVSAGLLPFRHHLHQLQVFLVHPGGPFWKNRDAGAWSLAKGEVTENEEPLAAARREFQEETGFIPTGDFLPLGSQKQPSGKLIMAWAFRADWDPVLLRSNSFSLEWPMRSGKFQEFPEVDRAFWFDLEEARTKLLAGQRPFLDKLRMLAAGFA